MNGGIMAFVPTYNCAPQIPRVINQLGGPVKDLLEEIVVVDNRSEDDTIEQAGQALARLNGMRWRILLNDENYGLGGSHKVAIDEAARAGHDWLLVLHGDDQADVADIEPLLRSGAHRNWDALLGARFMRGARLHGYSRVRTIGNHLYNAVFSLAARKRLQDLGSGLNLFRVENFGDGSFLRWSDDLTFNYYLSLYMADRDWRSCFFPISWREEDQRSNVKLFRQGLRTLAIVGSFLRDRRRFFATDHRPVTRRYSSKTVASSEAGG